jgi:hypothetical protein
MEEKEGKKEEKLLTEQKRKNWLFPIYLNALD